MLANYPDAQINLVNAGVGQITENDIKEASLFKALIFAMDTSLSPDAEKLAK